MLESLRGQQEYLLGSQIKTRKPSEKQEDPAASNRSNQVEKIAKESYREQKIVTKQKEEEAETSEEQVQPIDSSLHNNQPQNQQVSLPKLVNNGTEQATSKSPPRREQLISKEKGNTLIMSENRSFAPRIFESKEGKLGVSMMSNTGMRFRDFVGVTNKNAHQNDTISNKQQATGLHAKSDALIVQKQYNSVQDRDLQQTSKDKDQHSHLNESLLMRTDLRRESSSEEEILAQSTFELHNQSLLDKWNIKGHNAHHEVNMEKAESFETLLNDYMNHEDMAKKSNEEAQKLSAILHGHQGLTETFLGQSNKVRSLKKRVKKAQIQQKASQELQKKQKKFQLTGHASSTENLDHQRDSSNDNSKDTREKILATKTNLTAWLASQPQRFKPTSAQKWQSGVIYSEEQKQKAQERMAMLAQMKKQSFKSPFHQMSSSKHENQTNKLIATKNKQQYQEHHYSPTHHNQNQQNLRHMQPSGSFEQLQQLPEKQESGSSNMLLSGQLNPKIKSTSKTFYLYDQQLQMKKNRLSIKQQRAIFDETGSPEAQMQMQMQMMSAEKVNAKGQYSYECDLRTQNRKKKRKTSKAVGNTPGAMSIIRSRSSSLIAAEQDYAEYCEEENVLNYTSQKNALTIPGDDELIHSTVVRQTMENSLSGNGDSEIVGTEGDNTSKMHPKNFGPSSTVGRTDSIETFGEQVSQLFQADKKQNATEAKNLRIKLAKFTGSGAQPANNSNLESSAAAITDRKKVEDQVSKESPYFVVYNSSSKEKIQVGGPLTKMPISTPSARAKEISAAMKDGFDSASQVYKSALQTNRVLFQEKSSRTSSTGLQQQQMMDDIAAMQNYGDMALAEAISRQSPDSQHGLKQTASKTFIIHNKGSTLRKEDTGSGEYHVVRNQSIREKRQRGNSSLIVEGSALSTSSKNTHLRQRFTNTQQPFKAQQVISESKSKVKEEDKVSQQHSSQKSDGGQVETLGKGSVVAHSSIRELEEDKSSRQSRPSQSQRKNLKHSKKSDLAHVLVMNCEMSEVTDESGLVMGGTSSRFNPRNLLTREQTPTVRPLTGGEQGDQQQESMIEQEENTPMKPIEDSPLITSRAAARFARPRVQADQMIIEQDMSADEGVGPKGEIGINKIGMKSIELKIKPAEASVKQMTKQIEDKVEVQPLLGEPQIIKDSTLKKAMKTDNTLKIQKFDSYQNKSATIDYSSHERPAQSRAQVAEEALDYPVSSMITRFQSESKLSRDARLRVSNHKMQSSPSHTKLIKSNENRPQEEEEVRAIQQYAAVYKSNQDLSKNSLGETEPLTKEGHSPYRNERTHESKQSIRHKNEDYSKIEDENSQNVMTLQGDVTLQGDGNNYSQTSLQEQHDTYQTLIQNQSTQKHANKQSAQKSKQSEEQKVSAFKLPHANGKGDLLPALEKDLQEPNLSFKNLSRLFKDRQKEKFYSKNAELARNILKKVGEEKTNAKSNRVFTNNNTGQPLLKFNKVSSLSAFKNETSDYYDTGILAQQSQRDFNLDLSYKPQEQDQYNQTVRDRRLNMSELDQRRMPIHQNLSSFRPNGKVSLQPSLESVRENAIIPPLSKQQKKLNDLINLKYDIQRKRELSSLVHLSKPSVSVNDCSLDSSDYNQNSIQSISVMGQSHTQKMMLAQTGQKNFPPQPQQDHYNHVPQPLFGSESIDIANTSAFGASSRYTNKSHINSYKKHLNMDSLNRMHKQPLSSLPQSIRSSSEMNKTALTAAANTANVSIRISNFNQRKSRLNHSHLSSNSGKNKMYGGSGGPNYSQNPHMISHKKHPGFSIVQQSLNHPFNKTTSAKLSLDIAKVNQANHRKIKQQQQMAESQRLLLQTNTQDEYNSTNRGDASQNRSYEEGGGLTLNRQTERSEYDTAAAVQHTNSSMAAEQHLTKDSADYQIGTHQAKVPGMIKNSSQSHQRKLLNQTAHSYQIRQNSNNSFHQRPSQPMPLTRGKHDDLNSSREYHRQALADSADKNKDGGSQIVIQMKQKKKNGGSRLTSQRSNSMADLQLSKNRGSLQKMALPVSMMPILIVDSAYSKQSGLKSYKQRKLMKNLPANSSKTRLPTVLI